jgi:hypothetical protein
MVISQASDGVLPPKKINFRLQQHPNNPNQLRTGNCHGIRIPQNRKKTIAEYKTMKGKKAAKEMAQTQHRCNTCQRQKSKYCGQCYGFNKHKPNFTTMESYQ